MDDVKSIMMPPQIKRDFKQLSLKFIRSEKLPLLDKFGTIDVYFYCKMMAKALRTTVRTQDKKS